MLCCIYLLCILIHPSPYLLLTFSSVYNLFALLGRIKPLSLAHYLHLTYRFIVICILIHVCSISMTFFYVVSKIVLMLVALLIM